jgi:hypothetical protein
MQEFQHTYRGVKWGFDPAGVCCFEDEPPGEARKWRLWSRFFTPEVARQINSKSVDYRATQILIHAGIDRAINNKPLYTCKVSQIPRFKA